MEEMATMRKRLALCLMLSLLNVAAFSGVVHCNFVDYDDNRFILDLPRIQQGLTWDNFKWAMTTQYLEYWHPLVWLSHMLDCQLFHLRPMGHHLMNLGFHVIGTVMLFLVLDRLTRQCWRSAIVAALFAIHPTHVESVAWISERKDVLSALFYFAAIGVYCAYVRRHSFLWYAAALFCFLLSLASKPMGMTLPGVLLLVDYWPLNRNIAWRGDTEIKNRHDSSVNSTTALSHNRANRPVPITRLLIEKIPFALMSFACLVATYYAQKESGTLSSTVQVGITERIGTALLGYVFYLEKLIVPVDLSVFYPYRGAPPVAQMLAAGGLLGLITFAVLRLRRQPYLLVGWFWFLGTLVPVIGLVQVGAQSVADRYTYIPSVGLFMAIVWGAADLLDGAVVSAQGKTITRRAGIAFCAIVIAVLALATRHQVGFWKDSESLFTHAAAVTSDNWVAEVGLGDVAYDRGDFVNAANHYIIALEIHPASAEANDDLGQCLMRADPRQALPYLAKAVEISPTSPQYLVDLGVALKKTGRKDEARNLFRRALAMEPQYDRARTELNE